MPTTKYPPPMFPFLGWVGVYFKIQERESYVRASLSSKWLAMEVVYWLSIVMDTYILVTNCGEFVVTPDQTYELFMFVNITGITRSELLRSYDVEDYSFDPSDTDYPTDIFPEDVFPMDPDDYPVDGDLMTPY